MKKLNAFAVFALITPILTLGTGFFLAQQSAGQNVDREQQSTQRSQNPSYISYAPANGLNTRKLIGSEVKTANGENVGSVNDLIIGENGQVVAIVVDVEGLLGNESERHSYWPASRNNVMHF